PTPAPAGRPPARPTLGDRQERFLAGWAAADPGSPKICLSQTLWGCLQTDERGRAQFDADADAAGARPPHPRGGPPPPAARAGPHSTPAPAPAVPPRRTALELVKRAGALLCSGDQH